MKARRLLLGLFVSLALVVTFIPMIAFGEEGDMHELVIVGDYQVKYDEEGDAYAEFSHGELWTYYDHDEDMFAAWEGDEVSLWIEPEYGWNVKSVQYSLDGQTYSPADFDDKYETYDFKLPVRSGPSSYGDVYLKVEFEYIVHTITVTGATTSYDAQEGCYYPMLEHGAVYGLSNYDEDEDKYYGYDEDTDKFVGLEGQDIDLWVEPDEGYFVDSFDCYTKDGEIDVEEYSDDAFTFEMPGEDVTIDIGIEKLNEFSDLDDIIDTAEDIAVENVRTVNSNGADTNPKAEGLFKFVVPADGTYVFYSDNSNSGANPVGQVLFSDYSYEHDNNSYEDKNFCIYFEAEEGEVLYLQAITFGGAKSFNIGVKASDVKSIAFTPVSPHYSYGSCLLDFEDWNMPEFEKGDKITVTKKDNSTTTYVYEYGRVDGGFREGAFVNVNDRKDALPGEAYIDVAEGTWSAPWPEHAAGSTMTTPFTIKAAGQEDTKPLIVKFAIKHYDMWGHDAAPPDCYYEGHTAYWHCWDCGKYFADEAGTKELAEDSWILPPAHSWAWEITTPAGFLKNGSKIQHCTECGEYGSTAVVPGYAKYFVKGLKVKKGKKSFTVKWKKQSKKNLKQFNGYQIMYSTKADMSGAKTVNASKKAKSKTIKKLKKKTTYYVKVRSFTKKGNVTYYSNWSPVKKVKTK